VSADSNRRDLLFVNFLDGFAAKKVAALADRIRFDGMFRGFAALLRHFAAASGGFAAMFCRFAALYRRFAYMFIEHASLLRSFAALQNG
jgi:hypothetical protein